jgi:hypothetical protein
MQMKLIMEQHFTLMQTSASTTLWILRDSDNDDVEHSELLDFVHNLVLKKKDNTTF